MRRSLMIMSTAVMALSACKDDAPDFPALAVADDQCGASEFVDLLGQHKEVLDRVRFAVPMRLIGPGTMVTKDFRLDRLNILHDEAGIITRVYCG